MSKYIKLISEKLPNLSETELELINRKALLRTDEIIHVYEKAISAGEKVLSLMKTSLEFCAGCYVELQLHLGERKKALDELKKLKEELF